MKQFWKIAFLVSLISVLVFSCKTEPEKHIIPKEVFTCGAEKVEGAYFMSDSVRFGNSALQSENKSRTGKFSQLTDSLNPYAMPLEMRDVKKGEFISVTVWYNKDAADDVQSIIISDDKPVQYDDNSYIIKEENGWVQLINTYVAATDHDLVKIYGLNTSGKAVYWDDMVVSRQKENAKPPVTDSTLKIYIPPVEMALLDSFLVNGRKEQILKKEFKKYVSGFILEGADSIPVKLRLKGDWTDHLNTEKYSLRIKVRGDNAYDGLKSFSIQNPETRSMMMEWYVHKLCEYEDVLTTTYKFINVQINGEVMGVYALEEHFDKQLLESRNRREAPILKLDEDGLWQINYDIYVRGIDEEGPAFESSSILPFKKNRTRKSEVLSKNFLLAQNRLEAYKNLTDNPGEHLNLKSFAKYMAILDLASSSHSIVWHNQRQYYNPITTKLEPVLYDCYQDRKYLNRRKSLFHLQSDLDKKRRPTDSNSGLMVDPKFKDYFFRMIERMADVEYLPDFESHIIKEYEDNLALLRYEYPFYAPKISMFYESSKLFSQNLDSLNDFLKEHESYDFEEDHWEPYPADKPLFRKDIALKAYTLSKDSLEKEVQLINYHLGAVKVIGYSTDSMPDQLVVLEKPVELPAFSHKELIKSIKVPSDVKHLYYTPLDLNGEVFRERVSHWPLPKLPEVRKNAKYLMPLKTEESATVISGNVVWSKDVYATYGEKCIIEAGTTIDLVNGAGFMSEIPVEIRGTKENPVLITSSDQSSNGFTILSDVGNTKFSYAHFSGLGSMNKNNWMLTGAVTVYNHKVNIDHCSFNDAKSEDALNLVSCEFTLSNSSISTAQSDGFDADFCAGTIADFTVENTLNDALDFSGSKVEITRCNIYSAGDKAISSGERSNVSVIELTIEKANMGLVAKDRSTLHVSNSTVKSVNYAYAAFQKKPELGPAQIYSEAVLVDHEDSTNLIEINSTLFLDEMEVKGKEEIDLEALYEGF